MKLKEIYLLLGLYIGNTVQRAFVYRRAQSGGDGGFGGGRGGDGGGMKWVPDAKVGAPKVVVPKIARPLVYTVAGGLHGQKGGDGGPWSGGGGGGGGGLHGGKGGAGGGWTGGKGGSGGG